MSLLYIGLKVKIYLEPRSRASKSESCLYFLFCKLAVFCCSSIVLIFFQFLLFFLSFKCSNNSTRSLVFPLWNSQCMKTRQVLEIAPCLFWDLYFHHSIVILLQCVSVCSSNKHFWSFVTLNLCRWKFSVCVQRPNCFFLATYMSALLLLSCSVMSDTLQPHGLQHARLPCPSLSLEVCSNSCLLSQWCRSIILSSVTPFSSCHHSFPASVFSNESALLIRWQKYWSFSFNIRPSSEHTKTDVL